MASTAKQTKQAQVVHVDSRGTRVREGDRVKIVAAGLGAYPGHKDRLGTVVGAARLRSLVVLDGEQTPRRMHPSQFRKVRGHLAVVAS